MRLSPTGWKSCAGALLLCTSSLQPLFAAPAKVSSPRQPPPTVVDAVVLPAIPDELSRRAVQKAEVTRTGNSVVLANGFLAAEISLETGIIIVVENRLTSERVPIVSDRVGFEYVDVAGARAEWHATADARQPFAIEIHEGNRGDVSVHLSTRAAAGAATAEIQYSLGRETFWLERRLRVKQPDRVTFQKLDYGAAHVPHGTVRELKLGKFDAPRLITTGNGGIFAGVGWWFYEVKQGVYRNSAMEYECTGDFESGPWYVGVFKSEPGEPYAGWFWYKTFLAERKRSYDKQRSYFLWNARSGYDFRPISDPNILDYVDTAAAIGLDGLTTGLVRGVAVESERAATDRTARRVVDAFNEKGVTVGLHEGAVAESNWASDASLRAKLQQIDRAKTQGFGNLTVDFLKITDRFADHRRVAQFFRHIRDAMAYTECHLGMAAYGPQFQREVLINHPTDLHGFDIARFSADWATLAGFRHSRRAWQLRTDYLMPENGLFYFATHYSNYPRRYEEPEPQQFLFQAHAWRGLAYAFHDKIAFRDSLAAQSAFSTFYVFGYLDPRMPRGDETFARDFLNWVRSNADVLSRGRVVAETEDFLVMSKIRDGRGAVYAVNYTPGSKNFRLKLDVPSRDLISVRQIYPELGATRRVAAGTTIEVEIKGERLAIFEVNNGLQGLPPQNPSAFPVDVALRRKSEHEHEASFALPRVQEQLARRKDATLPERVVSADQTETDFVTSKNAGRSLGKLPREFIDAYGFTEDKFLDTWKAAPWAFGDRVWFVYRPTVNPNITTRAPVIQLNGQEITLLPRVQYEPGEKDARKWTIALWFADITEHCRFGETNHVTLSGTLDAEAGPCYVAAAPVVADKRD